MKAPHARTGNAPAPPHIQLNFLSKGARRGDRGMALARCLRARAPLQLLAPVWMSGEVLIRLADGVVRQIMRGIAVIPAAPGKQESVRPRRLRARLRLLVRRMAPRRPGPTPCQIFPVRFAWRHSRASARRRQSFSSNENLPDSTSCYGEQFATRLSVPSETSIAP
jgi:hypothetical protein